MEKKRKYGRGAKTVSPFAQLPHRVLVARAYMNLSNAARAFLVEFAYQYRGRNNGSLAMSPTLMEKRGLKSSSNLQRALKELEEGGFLMKTRQGHKHGLCSLYAITWKALDYDPKKHEVGPQALEMWAFEKNAHASPLVEKVDDKQGRRGRGVD